MASCGQIGQTTTDPLGNVTTKVTDNTGRLHQVKVGNATTTYAYNDNGTRKSLTYPNSVVAEYTYDAHGNQTSKTDVRGTASYAYDTLNRLETVNEPGGQTTSYTFDSAGNRDSQTITKDQTQEVTDYNYDALNRLENYHETTTTGVDVTGTKTRQYLYDNNGNLVVCKAQKLHIFPVYFSQYCVARSVKYLLVFALLPPCLAKNILANVYNFWTLQTTSPEHPG
jgi:YD repeat-containing protein